MGGIILVIVVAIVAASAVSRTRPDQPPATWATVLVTIIKEQVAANPEFSGNAPQTKPTATPPAPGPSDTLAASVGSPDPAAPAEANAEPEASFATDDPRVAGGIAENKAAYDKKEVPL